MGFIERLFGVSPDAGNGLTEIGIVVALVAVACLSYVLRAYWKRGTSA